MAGQDSPSTSVASYWTACFAGLAIGAVVHTLAYPLRPGFSLFDLKYLMVYSGGLLAVLGFGIVGMVLGRLRGGLSERAGFGAGLGVGLGGYAGAALFSAQAISKAILFAGFPVALVCLFLPWPRLPQMVQRLLAGAGLLTFVMLIAGVGKPEPVAEEGFQLATAPAVPPNTSTVDASGHPDVLLISVDTLRADTILEDGVPTPHLDALRARSMQAPYGHATTPSTLPSHVSMMLGVTPLQHGTYSNLGVMPGSSSGFPTLAERFQEAGYRTVGTAANGLLHAYTGFDRGFEVLVNVAPNPARADSPKKVTASGRRMVWYCAVLSDMKALALSKWLASRRLPVEGGNVVEDDGIFAPDVRDLALRNLDQLYAEERPYFYFLHFMAPHTPYGATKEFRGKLTADVKLPERYQEFEQGTTQFADLVNADLRKGHPDGPIGLAYLHDLYREEVMMVDSMLGEIFARVEASGRETVILFTSDHGEHFGENSSIMHGNTVYAPVMRVPFFLAGPGIEPGTFQRTPDLIDIPLTLLRAAGYPVRDFGDGVDLLDPSLTDSMSVGVHDDKMVLYGGSSDGAAADMKMLVSWKSADGRTSSFEPFALFREEASSDEATNLIDQLEDLADVKATFFAAAQAYIEGAADRHLRSVDPEELAKLSELGYVFDEEGNVVEAGAGDGDGH